MSAYLVITDERLVLQDRKASKYLVEYLVNSIVINTVIGVENRGATRRCQRTSSGKYEKWTQWKSIVQLLIL